MDHSNLLVVDAKCFTVCKTPNSRQLVHEDNVFISNVQVDSVQVSVQNLVVHWVLTALLKTEVHHSAQDFEEVLYDIVRGIVLRRNWQVEFVSLLFDH